MDRDEIVRRYPKLIRALRYILIGTLSEATCCIVCHKMGLKYCCEAVSHSGLSPTQRIQRVIKDRAMIREALKTDTR